MRPLLALLRKEALVLFGSPLAWVVLTLVALVTALVFFDSLRVYNQILFTHASSTMGGFDTDTIPDYVNLRDQVFFPVLETLGILLIGLVPLVTMGVFAEERARGTDELLLTLHLSPRQIVLGKFAVTFLFVALMMATSFIYPAMAIVQGGLGAQHLSALFLALLLHATALAAIGLACSAFSTSQLVAAVSAWALGFVFWDFHWASSFLSEGVLAFLDRLALQPRYGSLAEGLVRLADLVYFAGVAALGAALARFSFEWRRAVG